MKILLTGTAGQLTEAATELQVLKHQPESSPLCQAGIGVAMHGCVRFWVDGSHLSP